MERPGRPRCARRRSPLRRLERCRDLAVVVPSRDGLQPDLAMVARAILTNRTTVDAPLVRRHPAHDTAWANRLGITEQVSSFTTYYAAGQARVTNIHRAADIMNGTVV